MLNYIVKPKKIENVLQKKHSHNQYLIYIMFFKLFFSLSTQVRRLCQLFQNPGKYWDIDP